MDNLLFADDIEYEVRNTNSTLKYVPQGTLRLDAAQNLCRHQNALMCNVKAASLRSLYQTYAYRGLLSQNLRYFVRMPRVDDAMMATITEEPKKFWYLNNGIIIACKSYKVDGDILSLEDFSIINGGQTTHNIGILTDEQLQMNFDIPCKVIPLPTSLSENERLDFLAEISEATNTQKPITAIDAVANRREQRKLKEWLAHDKEVAIFYQTKRGETIDKTVYKEPWQKITTAELGQSLLAFLYQFPAFARNQRTLLFSNEVLYRQLFSEPFPPVAFIKDLRILRGVIKSYALKLRLDAKMKNTQKERLAANGEFLLLAILGLLYKAYINNTLIMSLSSSDMEENKRLLGCADIAMPFLNPQDAPHHTTLVKLLDYCLDTFVVPAYCDYLKGKSNNDYSNFSKTESNYLRYVLPYVVNKFKKGFTAAEHSILEAAFSTPTNEEIKYALSYKTQHPPKWSPSNKFQETSVLDKMLAYIKTTPKVRGIKAPTQSNLKKMITKQLVERAGLAKFASFTTEQLSIYADGLIQILKEYLTSKDE